MTDKASRLSRCIDECVKKIKGVLPNDNIKPQIGIFLGSGLDDVKKLFSSYIKIGYESLPGFPLPSVKGHAGELMIGSIGGKIFNVICFCGRLHMYEGKGAEPLKIMIRTFKRLGGEILFLTNAVGSLDAKVKVGDLVLVKDHINLMGVNPLVGPNDDEYGERFVALDNCWGDEKLTSDVYWAAGNTNIMLHSGVYAAMLGPNFETPAEIRMLNVLGASTVGMSLVPECLIGVHCGLKVVGVSAVTNLAAGMSDAALSHEQTLDGAKLASPKLAKLFKEFCIIQNRKE
jgi:xanthosine phosphorylase